MVVNGRPLKRLKRRVTADLYNFLTFPAAEEDLFSSNLDGSFRSNVGSFLQKHARLPPPSTLFPHLLVFQILFRIGELVDGPDASPAIVALEVVEEDVMRSRSVYCDQCRVVGWSGHPVCGKRYHFIIRADNSSVEGYSKSCTSCGDVLLLSDSRCKSCNYVMTVEDLEDLIYLQLEDTTHLLHGVVHTNGYGHLLRINGREGGSKYLSGSDIMDFWDRLCRTLGVRKVSVMDVSKKHGMEYRLLHAITTGHPWYGDWGYRFGAGSFALTLEAYNTAIDALSNIPLSVFFTQGRGPRSHLQDIISFYQYLSEHELINVRDLFLFLTRLIRDINKSQVVKVPCKKPGSCPSMVLCAWRRDDVDRVEQALIKVLRAVGQSNWVTWRALKGATCKVASPELVDYCLKGLGGKLVADGMIVCTRCNPVSDAVEYRLECSAVPSEANGDPSRLASSLKCPTEEHLLRDLKFLYDSILHPQTMLSYRPQQTRELAINSASTLLDCKQFVKDYKSDKILSANPFAIHLLCSVELVDQPKDYTTPPPELITLPLNATISDLKDEAARAFQDVYVMFKRFNAEELIDYESFDGSNLVKFVVGVSGSVQVRGRCLGKHHLHAYRKERGTECWIVDCTCGAKDDDGERMLACDVCGVWLHTRCAGILDWDPVPAKFECWRCETSRRRGRKGSASISKTSRQCKDETAAVPGVHGSSLTAFDCAKV